MKRRYKGVSSKLIANAEVLSSVVKFWTPTGEVELLSETPALEYIGLTESNATLVWTAFNIAKKSSPS